MRITELNEPNPLNNNGREEYEEFTDEDEEYYTEEEEDTLGLDAKPTTSVKERLLAAFKPANLTTNFRITGKSLMAKSWRAANVAGNLAWIVTTSMILVGLPVLYAYDREKNASAQAGQMVPLDATPSPL